MQRLRQGRTFAYERRHKSQRILVRAIIHNDPITLVESGKTITPVH
jgi:hypothetical protein